MSDLNTETTSHQVELLTSRSHWRFWSKAALSWSLMIILGLVLAIRAVCGQPIGSSSCQDASCVDIVFILDRSTSMEFSGKFEEVKRAMVSVLQSNLLIPGRHRVGVVAFPSDAEVAPTGELVPLTDDYVAVASALLETDTVFGDSNYVMAVTVAKDLLLNTPEAPETAKVIILLTDGAPTPLDNSNVCQAAVGVAQAAKDEGIRIFTIHYGVIPEACPDDILILSHDLLAAMATDSLNDQSSCEAENADGDYFFCQETGAEVTSIYEQVVQDALNPLESLPTVVPCAQGLALCDPRTSLMWEKKLEGGTGTSCLEALHAVDATCPEEVVTGNWLNMINTENGVGYAGFTDWRVPSVQELVSIVDYGRSDPAIDPIFGPTTSGFYWSSTSRVNASNQVWGVDFLSGMVLSVPQDAFQHVRAVRDWQE